LLQKISFSHKVFNMKTAGKNDEGRSEAAYPLYDLCAAVKVAEAVRDLGGGNSPVSKSLLAQHLKYAETGPSFFQRVAATKAFGLIDGRGSYSLTELARQYFYPTVENGKQVAAVKSLTYPRAFSILVQKFDGGKLPSIEMIGNIIHSEAGIPLSKKSILAGLFLRSAQFIGAIDGGGFLRCKALVAAGQKVLDGIDSGKIPKEFNLDKAPDDLRSTNGIESTELAASDGYHPYILPLSGNRKVTIKAPLDITPQEIKRLTKWIEFTLQIDWSGEEKKAQNQ
jgi:hypothetical protein